jgi:hypothetical protein
MVQAFPFSGVMNTDDPDEVIPSIHHRDALNIQWKGTVPNLRAETTPGTREKNNPFLTNDPNNLTIGRFYDSVNKRIFFFNYRGDDKKAIYMYDTVAQIFYRIVEEGVNAQPGSLGFTQEPIIHINIIYGDSTQGDLLCYINSLGIPKKINVQRAIAGGYGLIQGQYMDIAKQPADIPPAVVYENDPANTVNNCRKRLFRFKIRWVFDDKDKSVTSSQSEMPIPLQAYSQEFDSDPTKNCRIAITYQTGPSNVKKIEIIASNSLGVTMSDWYLVASLDKSVNNIPNNDVSTFLFYNDKAYNYIDIEESVQLFDYVPIKAGAQCLLNGNVLDYGDVTEGYDNLTDFGDGTNTSGITSSAVPWYYGHYFSTFTTNQQGLSGFGVGNVHIVVRGIILSAFGPFDTYSIYFTDGTLISYTVQSGDDSSSIIEGLRVSAIAQGFSIISSGVNDLVIFKLGLSLAKSNITNPSYAFNSILSNPYNAYDWLSKYGFGLVYFDEKGRTNGAVFTDGFSIQTLPYTENNPTGDITKLTASIYNQPPIWATYYQWVRTKNLSKSFFIQWVSDRTFKDIVALTGTVKYAYISIASLNAFKALFPESPLGYTFTSGDRIRFFKRYNSDNTTANLYGSTKDYEIVSSVVSPTINGQIQEGQFVKIILPATDGTFDFGSGFDNYFIELYTPAQPVANNLNVYYEFGERYAVGDPGLSTRFHQGMLQNQEYLVQPATFEFYKGDDYVRHRTIQTGNVYTWNVPQTNANGFKFLVPLNFQGSTYNNSNVTAHSVPYAGVGHVFNPSSDSRWLIQVGATTTNFKVGGIISISFPTARAGDTWIIYCTNRFGDDYVLVQPFDASNAGVYTFPITTVDYNGAISDSIALTNDNLFLLAECINNDGDRQMMFLSSTFTLTIDHKIDQNCIDPNFSDYFVSSVNSNGRAFVYDENAAQVTYPVLHRWSLAYQRNTNINQTNRFYSQNFDELIREFGAIKRMMFWDKTLTLFQERKVGRIAVFNRFISNADGTNQLITTTDIITSNNVQYYAGDFGVGNQPDSVVQSGFVFYFTDPIRGKQIRLSRDGLTDLSEVYKTQTWAANNISNYLNPYNYPFGGLSRITGTFNVRKDNVGEYLCVLQPGTISGQSVIGQTIAFDEIRNSFTSFYSFAPECIVCAENTLYSWRNGRMYIHDVTTNGARNVFYGTLYDSTITRVFNGGLIEKKSWMSLTEIANSIWDCPTIYTNYYSYDTTQQQSNLVAGDFADLESTYSASFWGDTNSINGLLGDVLKGNLIVIKFRATQPSNLSTLTAINLYFVDSPFTNR